MKSIFESGRIEALTFSKMAKFVGKWKLINTENFDEYMKALGVGLVLRKLGNTTKPSIVISQNGDTFTLEAISAVKTTKIVFKFGEEFDEKTADGREVKSVITQEGDNKLVHKQSGDPPSTLTRELQDDNTMLLTLEAKGVVATRTYQRE